MPKTTSTVRLSGEDRVPGGTAKQVTFDDAGGMTVGLDTNGVSVLLVLTPKQTSQLHATLDMHEAERVAAMKRAG